MTVTGAIRGGRGGARVAARFFRGPHRRFMRDRLGRVGSGKALGMEGRCLCTSYQQRGPQSAGGALALLLSAPALELTQSALGRAYLILTATLLVRRHGEGTRRKAPA